MSVYESANQLAQEIRNSEEFRRFIQVKSKIKSEPLNYRMVRCYQLKQFEIQQAQFLNEEISAESQQELERLYSLLSLNPSTREYLEAEFRITKLLNDVQMIIGEVMQDALPIGFEELDSRDPQ